MFFIWINLRNSGIDIRTSSLTHQEMSSVLRQIPLQPGEYLIYEG